jgi:tetratricopeptide (TPR) repeat protein
MLRLVVLFSFVLALNACTALAAAEQPGAASLEEIHRSLDCGEIGRVRAAKMYLVTAKRYRSAAKIASEAFFSAGLAYEMGGCPRDAAPAYITVVSDYPLSKWAVPAADALIESGERFLSEAGGAGAANLSLSKRIFSVLSEAEILTAETKARVMYMSGLCSLKTGDYAVAELLFEQVLEDEPFAPWDEKACFRLAEAYARRAKPPLRDQSDTMRAASHIKSFLRRYPESDLADKAESLLEDLRERLAAHLYYICGFYSTNKEKEAFDIYYDALIREYPETSWAQLAEENFKF